MQLIDRDRAVDLYGHMGPGRARSPAARRRTPSAGVAALGGAHGLCRQGQGRPARRDLRARPAGAGRGLRHAAGAGRPCRTRPGAAWCWSAPDGERSMNTYLGVLEFLAPADIDEALMARGRVDLPRRLPLRRAGQPRRLRPGDPRDAGSRRQGGDHPVRPVLRRAPPRRLPRDDPRRRRAAGRQRARADVALPDRRPRRRRWTGPRPRSRSRSARSAPTGAHLVEPEASGSTRRRSPRSVVDVTGAGDLFAAGLLHGLTSGRDWLTGAQDGQRRRRPRSSRTSAPGPRPTCGRFFAAEGLC